MPVMAGGVPPPEELLELDDELELLLEEELLDDEELELELEEDELELLDDELEPQADAVSVAPFLPTPA